MLRDLKPSEAIYFRDQFRKARFAVLRDAEAFAEIIFVLERLGMFLSGKLGALGDFSGVLGDLAGQSVLAREAHQAHPACHGKFGKVLEFVRDARNDAMHQGAVARHLTSHAVKLALVLEDALMNNNHTNSGQKVESFMVFNPVCAELWQPISFIRQTMLESSFSHLPFEDASGGSHVWRLVSEQDLAKYLRLVNAGERKKRLVKSLEEAEKDGLVLASDVKTCNAEDAVSEVVTKLNGAPVLVMRKGASDLIGILTAYDLL